MKTDVTPPSYFYLSYTVGAESSAREGKTPFLFIPVTNDDICSLFFTFLLAQFHRLNRLGHSPSPRLRTQWHLDGPPEGMA